MKRIVVGSMIFCLMLLCGCSSCSNESDIPSDEIYNNGYEEGYKDGLSEKSAEDYADSNDESDSFKLAIAELMYDREYGIVEKMLEYYPNGVKDALKLEFGTSDIEKIKEYINELSQTVRGNCEICGEPVYEDEFVILPEGIKCAHSKCLLNRINSQPKINKNN